MGFLLRMVKGNADLLWCASVLDDGFLAHPKLRGMLPRLWSRLLVVDAMKMVVVVDDRTDERVAFAASAVISDACLRSALSANRPNVALRIFAEEARSKRESGLSILRLSEIQEVNHVYHGANLAVLHYSEFVPKRMAAEIRLIRDKAVGALLEMQQGYCLKEFLMEFYGSEDLPFAKSMGMQVRNDYADFWKRANLKENARPYLAGLRLEEVREQWGSPLAMLFSYSAPVCFFSIGQQRVLGRARRGMRDREISHDLGVEQSTLREHWRGIFSRVQSAQARGAILSSHLPDFSIAKNRTRDSLLAYMHQHPEELQPAHPRYFLTSSAKNLRFSP